MTQPWYLKAKHRIPFLGISICHYLVRMVSCHRGIEEIFQPGGPYAVSRTARKLETVF